MALLSCVKADTTEKQQEKYSLSNRVDYSQKLPCAEEVVAEYLKWEQSKEGEEKKELFLYRRTGKLALTWGWYLEKLQEENVVEIEWKVLKICSEKLEQCKENNQEIYQKMLTTIVFILFVYPCKRNGGELKSYQHRMLKRVQKQLPLVTEDICMYPEIIHDMQFCKKIPLGFGLYCLKKWKVCGDKEQEVGEFIRKGEFTREMFSAKENTQESLRKKLEFMENYTAESRKWQECYVFQLIRRIQSIYIPAITKTSAITKIPASEIAYFSPTKNEEESLACIREQFEKLSQKGINLLEIYFKYKNTERSWGYRDLGKIELFLAIQKDKINVLSAEVLDEFVEQFGCDVGSPLVNLLDNCQIKITDPAKLHRFQNAICLYTSEEEMVRFYRKKLLPKEILNELVIGLRREKKIEKIPLLLQWMYGEDE